MDTADTTNGAQILLRQGFDRQNFARVRGLVRQLLASVGLGRDKVESFTYAVNEGMINAVMHGGGGGDVTLLRDDERRLVAVVEDRIPNEPFRIPTTAPPAQVPSGRGLWLADRLCDRLSVRRGERGLQLVLEQALDRPRSGSDAKKLP